MNIFTKLRHHFFGLNNAEIESGWDCIEAWLDSANGNPTTRIPIQFDMQEWDTCLHAAWVHMFPFLRKYESLTDFVKALELPESHRVLFNPSISVSSSTPVSSCCVTAHGAAQTIRRWRTRGALIWKRSEQVYVIHPAHSFPYGSELVDAAWDAVLVWLDAGGKAMQGFEDALIPFDYEPGEWYTCVYGGMRAILPRLPGPQPLMHDEGSAAALTLGMEIHKFHALFLRARGGASRAATVIRHYRATGNVDWSYPEVEAASA